MVQWITGFVVENKRWSEALHSLRIEASIAPFTAGQFTKLGLRIDGEIVSRPYSIVSAPDEKPLDFCVIEVAGGLLSRRLVALERGQEVLVAEQATGLLTLANVPDASHLWLIATGTGIGPFLSILKTAEPWDRFERVILVHAARTSAELSYRDSIQRLCADNPQQLRYIPFVSREPCDFALAGRVTQALADGRLEARAGIDIVAEESHVMLCGNPQMVDDVRIMLMERGLKKNSRREPGQISVETYW